LLPPPAELVIATQDSLYRHSIREPVTQVTNYHTFYLDETGAEMTDTLHGTLEDALEEAERGFGIKRDEWEVLD
jgi:arginine utilization protein RocB